MSQKNIFGKAMLTVNNVDYAYYPLSQLEKSGISGVDKLPYAIKILLEAALRQYDGLGITQEHVEKIASWPAGIVNNDEIPFIPARIVLQDFTGVPVVADLAAMREAMGRVGGDPAKINPLVPVDMVIDHSVMVDAFGSAEALKINVDLEFERNKERYQFLKWAQGSFNNLRIVPPSTGIIHQVNLEYLASVVAKKEIDGESVIYPDSCVGTDSHTTMINGLGVVGWGVGGIEAEAGMLGQPLYFVMPEVVGFKLTGKLGQGVTATDLALTVTQMLRKKGVVGKFVEFYGEGISEMSLPDRTTVANMAPEYGATLGLFPVDQMTINYLEATGRSAEQVALVEAYYKAQGMFRTQDNPEVAYSSTLELDLSTVQPCLAGPKRPQDRIVLSDMKSSYEATMTKPVSEGGYGLSADAMAKAVDIEIKGQKEILKTGAVVLASITSCTNTSNPSVMLGAGLLAKKAVGKGLKKPGYVKSSLTPGSLVVTKYLEKADLLKSLEALDFHVTGYGCGTCIGNSGPLVDEAAKAVADNDMTVAAVLSGNRNFEGRVHPQIKANYLASPILVVAYALAGRIDIDFDKEPIGYGNDGEAVFLKDIWPSQEELIAVELEAVSKGLFEETYKNVFFQNEKWNSVQVAEGLRYSWDPESTYIKEPPFFQNVGKAVEAIQPICGARALAILGDSVTTDHISPAGSFKAESPAGLYLQSKGIAKEDFNSYGSRRGNHEVMMRGTFANIRIRNAMANGVEGGVTNYVPENAIMPIYDAAMKYAADGTPLIILAGKEYGTGSSRDWAAKGAYLLGAKAVIAQSYERIHRSNLVGMGVLPFQFVEGENAATYGLNGSETYEICGLGDELKPRQEAVLKAMLTDGSVKEIPVQLRLDSLIEIEYYKNGGILQTVLNQMI